MGKVVKLEPASRKRSATDGHVPRGVGRKPAYERRKRKRRDKTALVLGGGGFTGGMYEIGALRALDLVAVNATVTDFDVYVGTSAGAFIAALISNGVTPEEMMRVATRQKPLPFKDIDLGDLLKPNVGELARSAAIAPTKLLSNLRQLARQPGRISMMDVALSLVDVLPSGLYSGGGIERYLQKVLAEPGRTDDFAKLACELYLTATDLDTCERVVFGVNKRATIPISTAARASGALPMVYAPVKVGDRELIDGGIVSTTNVDIAVQAGAKMIVVINPIVPYVNDFSSDVRTVVGKRPRRVSDMGFAQIGYQTFKLVAHQRLHELAKTWESRYPGVDIMLIEPEPTDELMFQTSMMSFTSRVDIARHGFESVTRQIAGEFDRFESIAARHGIEISPKRVRRIVDHFDASETSTSAWRKILEETTGALLRQSG